jgi:hypothetical protein
MYSIEEEDESMQGTPKKEKKKKKRMTFDDIDEDNTSVFQTTQASLQESLHDLQDEFVKFDDFSEPNLVKTGYLIPLQCGHNGVMSLNERTIYEIHLTNSGMI